MRFARAILILLIALYALCDGARASTGGSGPFGNFPQIIATNAATVWNNATSLNSTYSLVPQTISGSTAISNGSMTIGIEFDQTTTITGGQVIIEVSYNGTNWVNPQPWQVQNLTSAGCGAQANPYTLVAGINQTILFSMAGAQTARLRLNPAITGTGSVSIYSILAPYTACPSSAGSGGGGGTSSTFNTTFPATGTAIGLTNGGNMIAAGADSSGNLNIDCAFNCSLADEGTFAFGTTGGSLIGGVFQTAATNNPLNSGQFGTVQLTANRAMFMNLRNASGTEVGTAATPLQVSVANTGANGTNIGVSVASLPALPAGANTIGSVTQASGPWSTNPTQINGSAIATASSGIQKVGIVGSAGATLDAAIGGGSATNALAVAGIYNTAPPTPSTGQATALQLDSAGNLKISASNIVAQGSSTGGQVGGLALAAVTSASPSYATATTNPISLDTAGNLRMNCVIGCAASTNVAQFGGVNVSTGIGPSGAGIPRITVSNDSSVTAVSTNSLGQEVGDQIPGKVFIPIQVASVAPFTVVPTPPKAIQKWAIFDEAIGRQTTTITDGVTRLAFAAPFRGAAPSQPSVPVTMSPNPALQCPFTAPVNQAASTTVITNPGGKWIHVCGALLVAAAQEGIGLGEGTGAACATNTIFWDGGAGGTVQVPVNGGISPINDRIIYPMQVAGNNVCVFSNTGNVSGHLNYGIY